MGVLLGCCAESGGIRPVSNWSAGGVIAPARPACECFHMGRSCQGFVTCGLPTSPKIVSVGVPVDHDAWSTRFRPELSDDDLGASSGRRSPITLLTEAPEEQR